MPERAAQVAGLADGELDSIGAGFDQCADGFGHVFDASEKPGLVKKTMVNRNVEAAVGFEIEETMQAMSFHTKLSRSRWGIGFSRTMKCSRKNKVFLESWAC